jgi:hypothetical protein
MASLPSVDTPIRTVLNRCDGPGDEDRRKYVGSFLVLRLLVGVVGFALPFVLVFGERLLPEARIRTSLSGYYYSGMRDVFVGSLCAIAVFLVTYMAFHYVWDNVLSTFAGVAALGVALFPTAGSGPLTPLQQWLGEGTVSNIHLGCAIAFILSLAAISFLFGYRESRKSGSTPRRRVVWGWLHRVCGVVIVLAVVAVVASQLSGWYVTYSVLWGEALAAVTFGVSWLAKGAEWRILLDRSPARSTAAPEPGIAGPQVGIASA